MKGLLGLTVCMLPILSLAEYVVPVESVEEHVNVRMVPDSKSEIVGRLYRGDSAKLVKSGPEWHEIEIAGNATGFISADWTIVVSDAELINEAEAPGSTSAARAESGPDSKRNITELTSEEALSALENLEPVTFNYPQDDQERHVGFTAGNDPELVAASESDGLMPLEIVAVLTRIVKLQQDRIAALESRLEERN